MRLAKIDENNKLVYYDASAEKKAILSDENNTVQEPTAEDRLAVLEAAVLELGGMIGNG